MRTAIALAAVLLLGTTAGQAAAERYVALGDSYSSGTGRDILQLVVPEIRLRLPVPGPQAHRRTFVFAACGGAKTGDVINTQSASLTRARTVTNTIGGNDAGSRA